MTSSPYENLDARAFWSSGVVRQNIMAPEGLYKRKFRIRKKSAIATAGSCFAQHIARHLKQRSFNVMQYEPAPAGMSEDTAKAFSYGIYSCRYGNIYTAAQLLQLAQEALEGHEPAEIVWEKDGRYYDALRPGVEPNGMASAEEVLTAREFHLRNVRQMFLDMDVFVFTFGLTEAWIHKESNTVYPTAPGTIAGTYDPEVYKFHNFDYDETLRSFNLFLRLLRRHRDRKSLKVIVTVSPVPLTATASGSHVLPATTYSKSVLRAVCGKLTQMSKNIDYYPSYELITTPASRGLFYQENLRSVTPQGVSAAMGIFLQQHDPAGTETPVQANPRPAAEARDTENDLVCEEVLLESFNK